MKKFALSGALILAFILYGVHQRGGDEEGSRVIAPNNIAVSTETPTPSATTTPVPTGTPTGGKSTSTPTPTATPTPTPKGKYKDGSYTGNVADAYYGYIQVKAVISGGKITDVVFLQYPNDRSTSVRINTQAMPYLKQEAIQAQSANVSGVSGASASSGAFIESLGNALSQAS